MSDTAATLNEAYQLIENGQLARARTLLMPLLTANSNDPDVWWLYTHASEDPVEGRRALEKVLELSPAYPGASALYQELTGTAPQPRVRPLKPLGQPTPAAPPTLPDLPGSAPRTAAEPTLDEFDEIAEETRGRRLPIRLIALVAIIALILIGLLFVLSQQQPPAPPATETPAVAVVPTTTEVLATQEASATQEIVMTAEPTAATTEAVVPTVEVIPTEQIATAEEIVITQEPVAIATAEISPQQTEEASPTPERPTATNTAVPATDTAVPGVATATIVAQSVPAETPTSSIDDLYTALVNFNVTPPDGISTAATVLGNTLVVKACGTPGPGASQVLTDIMEIVTTRLNTLDTSIEALGVNISDCSAGAPGRTVAVPIGTARAYARREIDMREFQRLWRPVD